MAVCTSPGQDSVSIFPLRQVRCKIASRRLTAYMFADPESCSRVVFYAMFVASLFWFWAAIWKCQC